jgi:hypothetical protein
MAPGHKIYPYLLRDMPLERPNQVRGGRSSTKRCISRTTPMPVRPALASAGSRSTTAAGLTGLGDRPRWPSRGQASGRLGPNAVEIMDNSRALPTCPQPQQQKPVARSI